MTDADLSETAVFFGLADERLLADLKAALTVRGLDHASVSTLLRHERNSQAAIEGGDLTTALHLLYKATGYAQNGGTCRICDGTEGAHDFACWVGQAQSLMARRNRMAEE